MSRVTDNHRVRAEDKDEFYHDILDGLSVFLDSTLILDILHAIREYPLLRLGHSLNQSQVTCKRWLLDTLADTCGTGFGTVYVLGGWYGVLAAMLLHDPRFSVDKVVSVDIEPQCKPIAEALNRSRVESGKFEAVTADIYALNYARLIRSPARGKGPDLLINTSCEHLPDSGRWLDMIPSGTLLALQSNDYFDCEEHINCVADLEAFKRQMQLSEVLFQGQIKLKKYTRFMVVGSR